MEHKNGIPGWLWIIPACIIVVTGIITIPRIARNISKYMPAVRETSSPAVMSPASMVPRALVRISEGVLSAEITPTGAYPAADSRTAYDRAVTALLVPPSPEELALGYITCIPEGTRYLGSRLVRHALYIELSSQVMGKTALGTEGTDAMLDQFAVTLGRLDAVRQFLLISGDEVIAGPLPVITGR